MPYRSLKIPFLSICPWILSIILLCAGCHLKPGGVSQERPLPLKPGKIVVVGFRPILSHGDEPGVIRNPISGAVFMAKPVTQDVADSMTDNLFARLLEYKRYHLVGPKQAKGVFSSLVSSDQGMRDIEIFPKIGQAFSADAVMIGYIYRWQEREGTDYSVNRPASTAFDLYLIRPDDRAILWKGRFDKTQKSLSENLLDIKTFLKGRGRWMTVKELADSGLADLLDKSPLGGKERKED
ncbi:MAG: hypothetical protein JRC68_05540 [Deltaproteobacteria bacterium]|nr:hypothetical protein [Deltaproteobacteria bacterium]